MLLLKFDGILLALFIRPLKIPVLPAILVFIFYCKLFNEGGCESGCILNLLVYRL